MCIANKKLYFFKTKKSDYANIRENFVEAKVQYRIILNLIKMFLERKTRYICTDCLSSET